MSAAVDRRQGSREDERRRLRAWFEEIGSPEKVKVSVVTGRYGEAEGPTVLARDYTSSARPGKAFADEILDRVDGDYAALVGDRPYAVKYAVLAEHFARTPRPYDRFLIRRDPPKKRNGRQ